MWRAVFGAALALSQPALAQVQPPIRYAQQQVALRVEPRDDSSQLASIVCGAPVALLDSAIGARYVHIYVDGRQGFALAESVGAQDRPRCLGETVTPGLQAAMVDALIAELTENAVAPQLESGPCECPSDRASDGSRCGARSSFSRLGGADPADCI